MTQFGDKEMCDYPAAHSMDTEWFAVDADGNIGFFDSSEGGAVPETWNRTRRETEIEEVCDFLEKWREIEDVSVLQIPIPSSSIEGIIAIADLLQFAETSENVYDPAVRNSTLIEHSDSWIAAFNLLYTTDVGSWDYWPNWILRFKSDESFNHFYQNACEVYCRGAVVRFAGEESIFGIFEDIVYSNRPLIRELIKAEEITGAKPMKMYCHLHEIGIFPYSQDSNAPLPYEKMVDPVISLKLDDLPEKLQTAINWTRFDNIRFAEQQLIQPLEHMECKTWANSG